jgi:hypothetical protein
MARASTLPLSVGCRWPGREHLKHGISQQLSSWKGWGWDSFLTLLLPGQQILSLEGNLLSAESQIRSRNISLDTKVTRYKEKGCVWLLGNEKELEKEKFFSINKD